MAKDSKIEWTEHTANLWHGCTKVHDGCDHCYAEALSNRWGRKIWGNDTPRMIVHSVLNDFLKFQKLAAAAGEVHRVFVGSMMDIFEKPMPLVTAKNEPIDGLTTGILRDGFFNEVVPASPNLLFLLLTKRPSNINKMIPPSWIDNPPRNVMFGTSVSNQEHARTLIPQLMQVNGPRFLSIEPQLDEIHLLHRILPVNDNGLWLINKEKFALMTEDYPKFGMKPPRQAFDWVICGGESGHGKRPFNTDWARILRDECAAADVPFFMKQVDKIQPIPDDLMIKELPHGYKRKL